MTGVSHDVQPVDRVAATKRVAATSKAAAGNAKPAVTPGAISGLEDLGKRIAECYDEDKKRGDKRAESIPQQAVSQQKQWCDESNWEKNT